MGAQSKSIRKPTRRPYPYKRVMIEAGLPYANGPRHIGHEGGAQVPADIAARHARQRVGEKNVRFVTGTDDYGIKIARGAQVAGLPVHEFIAQIHATQSQTHLKLGISSDVYAGSTHPQFKETHERMTQGFLTRLLQNGHLKVQETKQWFDPKKEQFLVDSDVKGICPNSECGKEAFSDSCDVCGTQYEPHELLNPRSAISDATPILKSTTHLFLDMPKYRFLLREWLEGKKGERSWRKMVLADSLGHVVPSLMVPTAGQKAYREIEDQLPSHKMEGGKKGKFALRFEREEDIEEAKAFLSQHGIDSHPPSRKLDLRAISRNLDHGLPLPVPPFPEVLKGKSLYVWLDSLFAPISYTAAIGRERGLGEEDYLNWWGSNESRISQFIGIDNIFFYVLMEAVAFLGLLPEMGRFPRDGEIQLPTDVVANYHLTVQGEKMSKSKGNFFTTDDLLKQFSADELRFFLANMGLANRPADFDPLKIKDISGFLSGPMSHWIQKAIEAALTHFQGQVPDAEIDPSAVNQIEEYIDQFDQFMRIYDFPKVVDLVKQKKGILRIIRQNMEVFEKSSDKQSRESQSALRTALHAIKVLTSTLQPIVPHGAERIRESLNLAPEQIWPWETLFTPFPGNHTIGQVQEFFPAPASP